MAKYFDAGMWKKVGPFMDMMGKYFRYEVRGIENIPSGRPCLVVMNHGIIPFHAYLLANKIVEDLKRFPRGLVAHFLFQIPGIREFISKWGGVDASPENGEMLLRHNQIVILCPGGIYESLIATSRVLRGPWRRHRGFVKLAIRTKASIVPTYCQGMTSTYFNSYLFLKWRIKFLNWTRFSLPFFFGIGLLPFPVKLTHWIGRPIVMRRKRGETFEQQVTRTHHEVIAAEVRLSKQGVSGNPEVPRDTRIYKQIGREGLAVCES